MHFSEVYEQEKEKLLSQIEQLSKDLDKARDQLASKNRDNLKVQEGNLSIEEKLKDANSKLKQLKESLKAEEELRMKVDMRSVFIYSWLHSFRSRVRTQVRWLSMLTCSS